MARTDVQIARKFDFLFNPPLGALRYRVGYGGRGGAKSWQFGRALLLHGAQQPLRILCAREFQNSIADSVHALLEEQAEAIGLGSFYEVQKQTLIGANGTEFIFKGLRRNIGEVKSTEGVDVCWVEEAEAVSEKSWRVLTPTIRKPGSEIWVSFNPGLPNDPTYVRFVEQPPKRSVVRFISWRDNPWLSGELREEREDLLARDPEAEEHVWGGQPWARSDAQILNDKWIVEDFEPQEHWDGPYYGLDFGFALTPAAIVRLWIADSRLYVEYAVGGTRWNNATLEEKVRAVPGAAEHTIRADAARPETINDLVERGLKVEAAPKWAGSVEDGIAHLRSYEQIIIHPRCELAIEQARLWRYKTDPRTGDVMPVVQKGHDDTWDATRYGLAPLIKRKKKRLVGVYYPGMDDKEEE